MSESMRFSMQERGADAQISVPGEGGSVTLIDQARVMEDLSKLRTNDGPDWILLGYQGNSTNTIEELGCGSGGVAEIAPFLKPDMVAYALIRVMDMIDNVKTLRYCYITWMGDSVGAMKKAKYAVNKASVTALFGHYNVEILADDLSDITPEALMNKVQGTSGSRSKEVKRDVAKQSQHHAGHGAQAVTGFTVQSKPSASPANKKKFGGHPDAHTENQVVSFPDMADIKAKIAAVRNDGDETNWMLCEYNFKANAISLKGSGSGGFDEMSEELDESRAQWGMYRGTHTIDQTEAIKFVFVNFSGSRIPPLQRGKVPTLRGSVVDVFSPFHCEVTGSDISDITLEVVMEKMSRA